MTHIKVLYLKPNFSLEKVISAQFLLTSGNFFGNYSLWHGSNSMPLFDHICFLERKNRLEWNKKEDLFHDRI